MTTQEDRWLTRPEVGARLRVPPKTLAVWASQGKGPRYALIGKHARYRLSDVIAWENDQFSGGDVA
ncbi:Helix-turn-helix domain protein [Mycobacterium sp. THAF192]|nr:Helix-turn-helix domain protein [Mycobacterium sp. THAF192]